MHVSVYKAYMHEEISFLNFGAILKCLANFYIEMQALEKLK